jgi:hypothetical protein
MSQTSIRLVKTPDVDRVIRFLRERFRLLSEAEIIKLALSEMYKKEQSMPPEDDRALHARFNRAIEEGGKTGDKLLAEKGLTRESLSEQQIYDSVLDTHKHTT